MARLSPYGRVGEQAESDDTENDVAYNATRLTNAAESLTGYVTIIAEVIDVDTFADGENATTKTILEDESGAMDLVTWDESALAHIESLEGETVVIEDAKVGEHDKKRQLQPVAGLTEIQAIQPGVGYTERVTPDATQGQLADTATDGSEVSQAKEGVERYVKTECVSVDTLSVGHGSGNVGLSGEQAKHALNKIQSDKPLIRLTNDGWEVL